MEESWSNDDLFRLFVLQQQQSAMVFMGKLVHPQTNEIVRDLEAARFSIDLLGMLEEKTKGNLQSDEARLLGQVLTTLRLNFVDEAARKPPEPAADQATPGGNEGPQPPAEPEKAGDAAPPAPAADAGSGASDGPATGPE